MLTQLSTVKTRLGISLLELTNDAILNAAIAAISGRFDLEANRRLERAVGITQEFDAAERELLPESYPVEEITLWEYKENDADGWAEVSAPATMMRRSSVVSLLERFGARGARGRITYTGGYVAPGTPPGAGQTALPKEIEHAAIEQVCFWFQTRSAVGLSRWWPSGGNYEQFADPDLLPWVKAVLRKYRRIVL